MKRKSIVWQFYDKVIEDRRTKAVVCRLCDSEYKFLGNTTNLKSHLTRKHPLQWELVASQTEADDEDNKRPRYTYIYENDTEIEPEDGTGDQDEGDESRRGHEEWLEEDPFEHKSKRRRQFKSERDVTPVLQFEDLPERLVFDGASHSTTTRDQYDAFGDYVARRLRNLKSQNMRSNVQQLMTTMLWQAEFGAYEDQDSVKKALLAMVVDRPVVSYTAQVVLEDHAQPESDHGLDLKDEKGT